MDFFLLFPTAFVSAIILFLLVFLYPKTNTGKNKRPPKAGGAWPIIGHLHLLGGSQQPHKTLAKMAEKYGPVFTIKVGVYQTLVVSDPELAKECLTTNDKAFASRPNMLASELLGNNYANFGISPYGEYWRQVRKMVMLELLSQRRLDMLGHIRASEVKQLLRDVYEVCLKNKESVVSNGMVKIEMKQWFASLALNMVVRQITGKQISPNNPEGVRLLVLVRRFFELFGAFVVSDAIPYLRCLDLGGYEKVMKITAAEMNNIFDGWIQEHRRKKCNGLQTKGEHQVFMDVMISLLEGSSEKDLHGYDRDTIIRSTCQGILAAGTDTTTITLTWALSLLLNNPKVLKNAQDELDRHVGRERLVQESDVKNLVYLQAIIKESLRIHPPAPLTLPHESIEDCVVGGYNIPKGTRLLVNIWKIHRDSHIWPNPYEFRPERFLTSHKEIDVKGQNFELIPFGSGRRVCPGATFALQVVQFTLAGLLHGFDFVRPSADAIDMTEGFGVTNMKATPLEVLVSPRLSPNLYI